MSDPNRGDQLHVELKEGDIYRARLYQDEAGNLQLQLYDGLPGIIPMQWLSGIIDRFNDDLRNQTRQE